MSGILQPSPPQSALSEEEQKLALRFAKEVVDRGLAVPVLFLLEGFRPLNFVFSQALAFFLPVITIVFTDSKIAQVQEMLEKREAIPYICAVISQLYEVRRG